MPAGSYQGLEVEEQGRTKSLSALVSAARRKAGAGLYREAIELMHGLSLQFQDWGMPQVVLALVSDLRKMIPSSAIEKQDEAWLLNLEGVAHQQLGHNREARTAFVKMDRLGRTLRDPLIQSTAQQNLGTQAMSVEEFGRAKGHLRRSLSLKDKAGDYRGAAQVAVNLCSVALEENNLEAAEQILDRLEPGLREANDPGLLASIEGQRGSLAAKRREFARADQHYRAALKYARRAGQLDKELTALQNLGAVQMDLGLPGKAIRWLRRGLRLAEHLGMVPVMKAMSIGLALGLYRSGREREAARSFGRARELAKSLGDKRGWAMATADLGALSIDFDSGKAERLLKTALEEFRRQGDKEWQLMVLRNLAILARNARDIESAKRHAEQAIQISSTVAFEERADIQRMIAETLVADARTAHEAAAYFDRELSEVRGRVTPANIGWRAITAAALLSQSGAHEASLQFYGVALRTYSRIGDKQWMFHARNDRALALAALGRFRAARKDLRTCLLLSRRLRDRAMRQRALANLGEVARRQGRVEESIRTLRKALELARSLQDAVLEAEVLGTLGIAFMNQERWDDAKAAFESADAIAAGTPSRDAQATALGGLAGVALVRGRFFEAARLYERAAKLRGDTRDDQHYVEEIAGLTEALCAWGRVDRAERMAEELVNAAQRIGAESTASEGLARSGRRLMKRAELEEAADYYAASVAITAAGVQRQALKGEDLARAIAIPLTFLAVHASQELGDDQYEFSERVLQKLNEDYEGLGDSLREWLDVARSVTRSES